MSDSKPTYRLRFFFDYDCGGCLWSDNDAAYQNFDNGVLDADIFDLHGNIIKKASIKLPAEIKRKVLQLDKLFSQSIDWDNPGGKSLWDENQWTDFYRQTRELHQHISLALGDNFEIVYKQE
jgi:hypothetical protein